MMVMNIHEEDSKFTMYDDTEYVGEIDWEDFKGDYEVTRTFVRPEFGHRGLAAQLVEAMVEKARREGKKIIPTCPYAAAQFEKHSEYQPVLSEKTHMREDSEGLSGDSCDIPTGQRGM
jgi:predicted GNAT family acetyltransferase